MLLTVITIPIDVRFSFHFSSRYLLFPVLVVLFLRGKHRGYRFCFRIIYVLTCHFKKIISFSEGSDVLGFLFLEINPLWKLGRLFVIGHFINNGLSE